MKQVSVKTDITVKEFAELTPKESELVEAARQATFRSYSPYSHFSVGAAVLLDNGETITGANQENAAYPSGTCAERTAAYFAHARYPEARFEAIAIAARDTNGEFCNAPISPCGACRQALLEYEKLAGGNVKVLLAGKDVVYELASVESLLPLAFAKFA